MKKNIRILFIGNSHTYYNNMPQIAKEIFASAGFNAQVTMQTEGGKGLLYHCDRRDVIFNIIYGGYDYVVLQDVAKSFDRQNFIEGAEKIRKNALDKSTAKPVFYMIWAHRENKSLQREITASYAEVAKNFNALLAPAGEVWHKMLRADKSLPFYRDDGNHATPLGSYLAATTIFYAITRRARPLRITPDGEPHTSLELDYELCRRIHRLACRTAKKYNIK
ncbi:MAG: SGNH/GDSL hydrolase family protein [Clostridiales bacterium]|jgi:hypothetical protein|nr:SGNH/GDSL hydrolase family protein [Clostridiales bacterium]HOA84772.1 SGNH/GDSL hydrolase family protein [Bacillota bacterium]